MLNVMRYLGALPGEAPPVAPERVAFGEGDLDKSLPSPVSGFLVPCVDLLEPVAAGQMLGVVEDLAGVSVAEIRAPSAGTVMARRNTPSVLAGEIAFLLD